MKNKKLKVEFMLHYVECWKLRRKLDGEPPEAELQKLSLDLCRLLALPNMNFYFASDNDYVAQKIEQYTRDFRLLEKLEKTLDTKGLY